MKTLIFVIGAAAAGKTYFINEHYKDKDFDIFNVYDYQQKAYDEAGYGEHIPFAAGFRCLYKANDDLLHDIIERLKSGRNVVVEQTLYKMKRRLAYIDAIRESVADVRICFYVMCPSEDRWKENIQKRSLEGKFESYKKMTEEIEFPNQAEGIDEIYEVVDGKIQSRMELPISDVQLEEAREELRQEIERIRNEDEEKRKRKELIESMNTRPFWHYCEICGKKEFLTAQDAYDRGWNYPPKDSAFGLLLGPRICGDCSIEDTLFIKVHKQSIPIVIENTLTPKELVTWRRIKAEPESLLADSDDVC